MLLPEVVEHRALETSTIDPKVLEEGLEVQWHAQEVHQVVGVEAQVEVQRHALEVEDLLAPYDSGDAYQAPF